MKPFPTLSSAALLAALTIASPFAFAGQIIGDSSGLANPGVLITFDPPPAITMNAAVTSQYSSQGVTFDYLYYSPYDPDNDGSYQAISGNYLGNYQFSDSDPVLGVPIADTLTISFTNTQMRAAFGLQSNGGDVGSNPDTDGNVFTFTAYLGGVEVDSFTTSVYGGYYGFYGEAFDSITVASCIPNGAVTCGPQAVAPANPDYYLLDNLQFDAPLVASAAVPEPGVAALFGLGLVGAALMRRRSSHSRAA